MCPGSAMPATASSALPDLASDLASDLFSAVLVNEVVELQPFGHRNDLGEAGFQWAGRRAGRRAAQSRSASARGTAWDPGRSPRRRASLLARCHSDESASGCPRATTATGQLPRTIRSPVTARSPTIVGGFARIAATLELPSTGSSRTDRSVGTCGRIVAAISSSRSCNVDAFMCRKRSNFGHQHRSRDAIFIHWLMTGQIPKRLLVTEHEVQFRMI